jgi:ribonuclease BN (tRNA processing enzyme)
MLAKGADLFVCECSDDRDAIDTHLSWELLAPRFSQLEARKILLTHFSASMRNKLKQLAAPRVQFADDGMVLRLRSR